MSPRRDDLDLDFILAQRSRKKKRAERLRRRRRAGVIATALALALLAAAGVAAFGAGATLTSSCDLNKLRPPEVHSNSFIYARDGSLLGSIPSSENREPVSLVQMTPWLPKASVAIEDRRFYQHGGVDYVGIARAAWKDLNAGKVVEGGSTITQQLVRNLYTGQERTYARKLKEACLAIKLSQKWTKDRILKEYLNTVFYGNHAYGVEAAAQTYFSRHAQNLTLLQAAMIAGLPQAPNDYDPFHNPQGALNRRDEVLRAMLVNRAITLAQYRAATRSNTLNLKPGRIYTRIKEPYFFSYVRDELQREYGSNTVRSGGLRVYTTIDPRLQRLALKSEREILPYRSDPASAVVSVQPGTGAIRAMTAWIPHNDKNLVGNTTNQLNLAAQSTRQAGSTFKTFVLASAIEMGIDPDSTYYASAPFTCTTGPWCLADYLNGKPWTVHTYDNSYRGSISVTSATLASDNTVYAQLTLDVGPDYVWRMARRLGVHLTQKPVASIGLGSLSVSPLDMAAAYATFASGGIYAKPMAITKVVLPGGKVDRDAGWGKPKTKRAISEGVAYKVTEILRQNALSGTGAGSGDGIHPNAGKTGTTSDHVDAWFDGYTRELSTVVWMGYLRGETPPNYSMLYVHGQSVAGATFDVPIWHAFMSAALYNRPAHEFLTPTEYPTYHSFVRGRYGSSYSGYSNSYSSTPSYSSTTTQATTTSAQPPAPAPTHTAPAPRKQTLPPPAPVVTTPAAPPPTTTVEPTPTTPGPTP
jgi:penicillin-binding protein 1A